MTATAAMAPSAEIRETVQEFCRRMLAGEADEANDLISRDPALVFIGSAGEWVDDQDKLRAGTQEAGEGLIAGHSPVAYADGDMGFFADQPTWLFADGTKAEMRLTAVLRREAPGWRVINVHMSVAVGAEPGDPPAADAGGAGATASASTSAVTAEEA